MRFRTLFTAMFVLGSSGFAHAQDAEPICTPGISYMGFGAALGVKLPYTLKAKSTFEQRLPDGSYIRGYMHVTAAQDSKGRRLSQFPQGCHSGKDGKPEAQLSISVFDPETKISETWQVGGWFANLEKVAHIWHQPSSPTPVPAPKLLSPEALKLLSPEALAARRKANEFTQSEYKTEDLGTRYIAGVMTKGTRTTRTIPPGEEGNELPLVIITESWSSKELGGTLMNINDDPRRGRYTWEVEEISRTEPDPALFNPPADYKIVDDPLPSAPVVVKP